MSADLASCVCVGLIPLLYAHGQLGFFRLAVLLFVGALLEVPGRASRMALMPELVQWAGASLERTNAFVSGPQGPIPETVFQERVPADMRGRVFGIGFALQMVANPPGMLLAGFALEHFGVRPTLVCGGAIDFAVSLGFLLLPALPLIEAGVEQPAAAPAG